MGREKGRPTKPAIERKQQVSISLSMEAIQMLDELRDLEKFTRSKMVESIIRATAFEVLKLKEKDGHLGVPKWTHYRTGSVRPACNPRRPDGKMCGHPACIDVYKRLNWEFDL